jgi:hypothetical protein
MHFPDWLDVYGDREFRGDCPTEAMEQVTFFARLRAKWPDTLGRIAIHPRNEGVRTGRQAVREKAEGMTKGAPDVVIPGCPSLVLELKRRDHTKSAWQTGQVEYLEAAHYQGASVCVALGADAAMDAVESWLTAKEWVEMMAAKE